MLQAGPFDLKRAQDRVYRRIASETTLTPATSQEIVDRVNRKWFADFPAARISTAHVNWAARRGFIKRTEGRPPRFFVDKLVPYEE